MPQFVKFYETAGGNQIFVNPDRVLSFHADHANIGSTMIVFEMEAIKHAQGVQFVPIAFSVRHTTTEVRDMLEGNTMAQAGTVAGLAQGKVN